ncbi:MAG: hypothetical protein JXB07_12860 [Anaerolineae bacterium]|nr:hypothetical protein [Anaerolineae bacterium]
MLPSPATPMLYANPAAYSLHHPRHNRETQPHSCHTPIILTTTAAPIPAFQSQASPDHPPGILRASSLIRAYFGVSQGAVCQPPITRPATSMLELPTIDKRWYTADDISAGV